ncbi:hypothetical protein H4R24_004129 [Coemansia sp. RSA 988]|nr:hypothetical protein H4R24_004129 [Coemansia sp. RSA 988]
MPYLYGRAAFEKTIEMCVSLSGWLNGLIDEAEDNSKVQLGYIRADIEGAKVAYNEYIPDSEIRGDPSEPGTPEEDVFSSESD